MGIFRVDDRPMPAAVNVGLPANVVRSMVQQDGGGRVRVESIDALEFSRFIAKCFTFKQLIGLPIGRDGRSLACLRKVWKCRPAHWLHASGDEGLFQFFEVIHRHGVVGWPERSIQIDPSSGRRADDTVGHSQIGVAIHHQHAAPVALKGEHARLR
ncbi:hypothetical protein D3C71_1546750 [compost metagenome]